MINNIEISFNKKGKILNKFPLIGHINENEVVTLSFIVDDSLSDYGFILDIELSNGDKSYDAVLIGTPYIVNSAILQGDKVKFQLVAGKDEEVWKSDIWTMGIQPSINAEEEFNPDEHVDILLTIQEEIQILQNEISSIIIGQSTFAGLTDSPYDNTLLSQALNSKQSTIATGTTSQYFRGDKTWQTLNKTAVGLSNVDNTSDVNKPISIATQNAIDINSTKIGDITTLETTDKSNTVNAINEVFSDIDLKANKYYIPAHNSFDILETPILYYSDGNTITVTAGTINYDYSDWAQYSYTNAESNQIYRVKIQWELDDLLHCYVYGGDQDQEYILSTSKTTSNTATTIPQVITLPNKLGFRIAGPQSENWNNLIIAQGTSQKIIDISTIYNIIYSVQAVDNDSINELFTTTEEHTEEIENKANIIIYSAQPAIDILSASIMDMRVGNGDQVIVDTNAVSGMIFDYSDWCEWTSVVDGSVYTHLFQWDDNEDGTYSLNYYNAGVLTETLAEYDGTDITSNFSGNLTISGVELGVKTIGMSSDNWNGFLKSPATSNRIISIENLLKIEQATQSDNGYTFVDLYNLIDEIYEYIDEGLEEKVSTISPGTANVTIGGTTTNPTISVDIETTFDRFTSSENPTASQGEVETGLLISLTIPVTSGAILKIDDVVYFANNKTGLVTEISGPNYSVIILTVQVAATFANLGGVYSDNTSLNSVINSKENSISNGTTTQYWRGDKTWQTLNKAAVGLSNVDNTSDSGKPISTAVQAALDTKQNVGNYVIDDSYNHTDNNYTTNEKNKLAGIASGAEVNSPLYSTTGTNTDGAMTQNATTTALNNKVDSSKQVGVTTVTVLNDGTEFKATTTNGTTTTFARVLPDESDIITQTDHIGSESAIYTYDAYAIMERKKYVGETGSRTFISQQLYLEDGNTRPQYDYKTGGDGLPTENDVKEIAFTEDIPVFQIVEVVPPENPVPGVFYYTLV